MYEIHPGESLQALISVQCNLKELYCYDSDIAEESLEAIAEFGTELEALR